jgi:uroporphyrinogen-III decarboxylase
LTERLRYVFADSTLVQEKFLLDDFATQLDAFEELVRARRWRFDAALYQQWQARVGDAGLLNAGELFSPLKLLHLAAGADQAVFLLADHPERCRDWIRLHEAAQLDLVRQMLDASVPAMMSMDNLDSAFHTPRYIERCSASFYEQASRLCRARGVVFFIHACGQQKALLPLIGSLGVGGLEGVAYAPLGNVELDEALRLSGERLIVTGGISAFETERLSSYDRVRRYLEGLLQRLEPYRHRFVLSSSCNTSINTPWSRLVWFRDAWRELTGVAAK